ncbi:MAG: hypothetical protein JEZ06_12415 [Anaerolineaceae bacterium]|nr:hypothetical protein [Anaerolineaceae bacterium]
MQFSQNHTFTGRDAQLIELARVIFQDSGTPVISQSIIGIGGIGKTQLAVEFCFRYGRFFHGVHWIDARPIEASEKDSSIPLLTKINAELAQCGSEMMLPAWPAEQPEQVCRTLATWAKDGTRIVVLDNLESEKDAQDILQRLSSAGDLRVLITARKQDWPKSIVSHICRLGQFLPDESLSFFSKK